MKRERENRGGGGGEGGDGQKGEEEEEIGLLTQLIFCRFFPLLFFFSFFSSSSPLQPSSRFVHSPSILFTVTYNFKQHLFPSPLPFPFAFIRSSLLPPLSGPRLPPKLRKMQKKKNCKNRTHI